MNQTTDNADNPSPDSASSGTSLREKTSQFVGFYLDGQQYAFRIQQIQEIVFPGHVTRTPNVPAFVEGVSNLRGNIIPVISLRRLLDMEACSDDEHTRTIVVNVDKKTVGCKVDSVSQVIRLDESEIQPPPTTLASNKSKYISGFANCDERLVIVLDVDELLDPSRLTQS